MYQSPVSKPLKIGPIKTSKTELIDILKAWIAISLAFTFVFTGVYVLSGRALTNLFTSYFLIVFLVLFLM